MKTVNISLTNEHGNLIGIGSFPYGMEVNTEIRSKDKKNQLIATRKFCIDEATFSYLTKLSNLYPSDKCVIIHNFK